MDNLLYLKELDKFSKCPNVICNSGFHGGSDA
jgi:hypothetical protein